VFYTDSDPSAAAAAVRSLINSYEKVYQAQQGELQRQRLKVLEDRRTALRARLDRVEADIQARVNERGVMNLEPLHTSAVQQALKLATALNEVRRALALAQMPAPLVQSKPPEAAPAAAAAMKLTARQIAMTDPVLRGYIEAQARREEELLKLQASYGDAYPSVVRAKQAIELGQDQIDEYAQTWREMRAISAANPAADKNPKVTAKTPDALRVEEAGLVALQGQVKEEMVTLGAERLRMERLRADEESARKELAEVTRRMGAIDAEEALGGRLSVISRGDIPLSPLLDRHVRDASAGAVGGFLLPGSLLVVIGLCRPRYRFCRQVSGDLSGRAPMFAVVPELSEDLADRAVGATAARCVHQLRVRLSAAAKERKSSIYLVTSSSAGEGKTSLTLSLAASFSASGFRTLVIDGDLAGRGVTIGLGVEGLPGLREAAEAGRLRDHLRGTRGGLCILPTGLDDQLNAYSIPQASVEQLVQEARGQFDVILIDTGAVFASIEASVLAPQADGVIFAVARGQRESMVGEALRHLDSLGAKLAGIVFNGADVGDFGRSLNAGRTQNFFSRTRVRATADARPAVVSGFGPMVDATLWSLPPKQVAEFEMLYQNPETLPHSVGKIPKAA
jgi:Mrp family chromosome partitioning ATPase